MSDAILFGKAAGVDQAAFCFSVAQGETKIDARARGRFDLSEDVVPIERDNGLTWAGLRLFADLKAQLQQGVIDRPQLRFRTGEHFFDVAFGGFEIVIRITDLGSFALSAFGQPPGRVRAQAILGLEPLATRLFVLQALLLY